MYKKLCLIIALLLILSCGQKKPTAIEGKGCITISIATEAGEPVADAEVRCVSVHGKVKKVQLTDKNGKTIFKGLPSSKYTIKALKQTVGSSFFAGSDQINLLSGEEKAISVTVKLNSLGLKINEIYYPGPINSKGFYGDQFIELYNATDDTIYLDGMIIIRAGAGELAARDYDQDGNLDFKFYVNGKRYFGFVNAFRLSGTPGKSKKYPVAPGGYVVIARDAKDHRIKYTKSIDLSHADFEFYAKYDNRDSNNLNVPDFLCMLTGEHSPFKPNDLDLNVKTDIVLLATGEDSVYWDGIDMDTIIDGVEYANDKNARHRADEKIDRGIAGSADETIISKYSGKSIQRWAPGFDTNNSTIDFKILEHPTPGYQ